MRGHLRESFPRVAARRNACSHGKFEFSCAAIATARFIFFELSIMRSETAFAGSFLFLILYALVALCFSRIKGSRRGSI